MEFERIENPMWGHARLHKCRERIFNLLHLCIPFIDFVMSRGLAKMSDSSTKQFYCKTNKRKLL